MEVVIEEKIEEFAKGKLWRIRNALSQETCEHLKHEFIMIKNIIEATTSGPTSDPIMPGAFAMYSPVCFEAMGQVIKNRLKTPLVVNYGRHLVMPEYILKALIWLDTETEQVVNG